MAPKVENSLQEDPTVIEDDAPFPVPELYFTVFDSEKDEPESKINQEVNQLYQHWFEKYGRPWPENGLGTEDLVWLHEHAYNEEVEAQRRVYARLHPVEEFEFPNQFMSDTDVEFEKEVQARGEEHRREVWEERLKEKMEAEWVTDEFESEQYEKGNLEQLYGMYLWDDAGDPLLEKETVTQEGQEPEEWDDFHSTYRPRDVMSEDVREALWVTDEFESDEDNTESEWEPEYVGAGVGLEAEDPLNPQYSLRHSHHPLAPFPGAPLEWYSWVFGDGTTYEGLSRHLGFPIPHGMGVMVMGTGTGGGFDFKNTRRGDKYEGEFQMGFAHGLGMYTSEMTGEVYLGEFAAGHKHGCGVLMDMSPFYFLVERGMDPSAAYQRSYRDIMANMEWGTWYRDVKLGNHEEDEHVLYAVLDDFSNPYDVVIRNKQHEAELKAWTKLSTKEKALDRVVRKIEHLNATTIWGSEMAPPPEKLLDQLINYPVMEDTEDMMRVPDAVEIAKGYNPDGTLCSGTDSDSDSPPVPVRRREMNQAKFREAADKMDQAKRDKYGKLEFNPFTGLSVYDYLEGYEGEHNDRLDQHDQALRDELEEMMADRGFVKQLLNDEELLKSTPWDEEDETTDVDTDDAGKGLPGLTQAQLDVLKEYVSDKRMRPIAAMSKIAQENLEDSIFEFSEGLSDVVSEPALGAWERERLEEDMRLRDESDMEGDLLAEHNRWNEKFWADRDTDTAFETESDMMEMCDLAELIGTLDEAQDIVARARMWRWKPWGEVSLRRLQDAQGTPVELMQDPLHYPFGTKFMAPGPAGQVHPVPDDPAIRLQMIKVAENLEHVYNMYNFDWDPQPGSVQWRIDQRIQKAEELRLRQLGRLAADVEEVIEESKRGAAQPQELAALAAAHPPGAHVGTLVLPRMPFASLSARLGLAPASRVVIDAFTRAGHGMPGRPNRLARLAPAHRRR